MEVIKYAAMKGYRVFVTSGFRLPKTLKSKAACKLSVDYRQWQYEAWFGKKRLKYYIENVKYYSTAAHK